MQKLLAEKVSIDMVLVDPPYGMKYKSCWSEHLRKTDKVIDGDDETYLELLDNSLRICSQLMKTGAAIYIYCGWQQLDSFIRIVRKYFKYKNLLIWLKNNWSAGDLQGNYGTKTEFVIFATKGRHILQGKRNHNVLQYDRVKPSEQVFKFQKPTQMLEFLITKSSKENDTILDFTMGSGSTGVACMNLNRKFIGIELEEKYYNIAQQRLMEATQSKQTTLI